VSTQARRKLTLQRFSISKPVAENLLDSKRKLRQDYDDDGSQFIAQLAIRCTGSTVSYFYLAENL
jgi:hypothetical protein